MPSTRARDGETVDSLMRRFRRNCDKEGRAARSRKRQQGHQTKSQEKRRAKQMARKRHHKKIAREIKILLNGREHHKGGVGGSGGLAGFL